MFISKLKLFILNFKYFDFPIYLDDSDNTDAYLQNDDAIFHVFVNVSDWNQENKELLFKILQAIKLDIKQEVQIIGLPDIVNNSEKSINVHISENLDFSKKHRFLAFGLNANRLGLQIKTIPYKIIEISNLKILFSHKLSDLQKNVSYKKQLWGLLQKFNFNE